MRWWMLGSVVASHIGLAYGLATVTSTPEVLPKQTSGVQITMITAPKIVSMTASSMPKSKPVAQTATVPPARPVHAPIQPVKPAPTPVVPMVTEPLTTVAQAPTSESTVNAVPESPPSAPSPEPSVPVFVAANGDAAHLNNPKPNYPEESLDNEEEGTVLLSVYISESGQVNDVTLKNSSGFFRLDEAAMSAVRRWTFIPAMREGVAVAGWHTQRINFKLQ